MLLFTLFTACTQDPPPVSGSLQLCIPDAIAPSMSDEAPVSITGDLLDVRSGLGACAMELVIQEGDTTHIVGFSIIDPNGADASVEGQFQPQWSTAENVTLTVHTQFSFGFSHGIVLEDASGIMMALEEGLWGGALSDAGLPFIVEHSENDIGIIEEECIVSTGHTLQIAEEHMAPFGEFDIELEGQGYTFGAIAAMSFGPGKNCSVSDLSDHFSWSLFRHQ